MTISWEKSFTMSLATLLVFSLVTISVVTSSTTKVDPRVLDQAREKGTTDIIIHFTENNTGKILDHVKSLRNVDHRKRSQELYTDLKGYADKVQSPVLQKLETRRTSSMRVSQLWSLNLVSVKNVDIDTVRLLAAMPQVSAIREDRKFPVAKVQDLITIKSLKAHRRSDIEANQWNIDKVGASSVWSYYNNTGQGIVVGSIDTGVRASHICLMDKYLDNCWLDPYRQYDIPTDTHGHGTHTIGTMCGDCGVGVAPGAKFSACRGCGDVDCTESALIECGGWMMYPTNAKGLYMEQCTPHIINNSWGGDPADYFYYDMVKMWNTVGILNFFSCGNSGPNCSSIGSPADYDISRCAAATDSSDKLADFSSRGPSLNSSSPYEKPSLAGPGVDIVSTYMLSDESGASMSGTSMASPHIAGVAALMLNTIYQYNTNSSKMTPQCANDLAFALVQKTSQMGTSNGTVQCAGVSATVYPGGNPFFGAGICNIKEAYAKYEGLGFDCLC